VASLRQEALDRKIKTRLAQYIAASRALADAIGRIERPNRKVTLAYLVLRDVAVIFHVFTDKPPTRRVTSGTRVDSSETYGPFYDFARAVWVAVFGTDVGLHNSLKDWKAAETRHKEKSPAVDNYLFRLRAMVSFQRK
jgi:hypothetical protein